MLKKLVITAVVCSLLAATFFTLKVVKSRAYVWMLGPTPYSLFGQEDGDSVTTDMFIVVADHWESGNDSDSPALARSWLQKFRTIADAHVDSQGRAFRYTWFFPIDNFNSEIATALSEMARDGYGEIEVHWHHTHLDSYEFESDLQRGLAGFLEMGALSRDQFGHPKFVFIHGNWALDNSRESRNCGINNEIEILLRNGAVADMTFPALGTTAQPGFRGAPYYSIDDPGPKSYSKATPTSVGTTGQGLMILSGPLGLDFRDPVVLFEYGALDDAQGTGFSGAVKRPKTARDYFERHRPNLWSKYGVRVKGFEQWVFVKLHAHGMQHADILLGGLLDEALTSLEKYAMDREIRIHYVTAREMYNIVRSVESGAAQPQKYEYDFELPPPPNLQPSWDASLNEQL